MAERATREIAWRLKAAAWLRKRAELAETDQMVEATAKAAGLSEESVRQQSEIIAWVIGQAALGLLGEVEMIRNGALDRESTAENLLTDEVEGQVELPFKGEAGV